MTALRKIVFWCHLVVGVFVATIVVIMSATGVLLTYQKQMTLWADTRGLDGSAPVADATRLPMDSLLRGVQQTTGVAPTSVTVRSDFNAPVEVVLGRDRRAFVNAYTGAVLGEGSATMRGFFRGGESFASQSAGRRARSFLRFAHTGEYFGITGQTIAGLVTFGSLVLVWTGLALALRRLAAWRRRRARRDEEAVIAPIWNDRRDVA